jgi:hypothetical protein
MRDPEFRRSQENGLRLPHVAPINALVDALRGEGRGWVPYIAPVCSGVEARMLSILQDHGSMTDSAQRGGGFLCLENDDATAERFATVLIDAGLGAEDMVPGNAFPIQPVQRRISVGRLAAGM